MSFASCPDQTSTCFHGNIEAAVAIRAFPNPRQGLVVITFAVRCVRLLDWAVGWPPELWGLQFDSIIVPASSCPAT